MKEIILWRGNHHHRQDTGQRALVSDRDHDRVSEWFWTLKNGIYPTAQIYCDGRWQKVVLHRFVLNATAQQLVDHIDRNPLNCQRDNLRFCTKAQNSWNRLKARNPRFKSAFKGVQWKPTNNKDYSKGRWMARITRNNRNFHIGYFDTEHQAAMAYDLHAVHLHGQFALTNFNVAAFGP